MTVRQYVQNNKPELIKNKKPAISWLFSFWIRFNGNEKSFQ